MNQIKIRNQKGFALVYLALITTSVIGLASFIVDIGISYSIQTRIKNAVDLAALAGIGELQNNGYISTAKNTALNYLNNNLLASVPGFTSTNLSDHNLILQAGIFDSATNTFTWDELSPNVNALKVGYSYNTMSFFGSIFMINSLYANASVVASKQPAGYIAPGSGFPLVIYSSALTDALSNSNMVDLYTSSAMDNSYWTDFTSSNPSTNDVRNLLDYIQYGTGTTPPGINVNDSFAINDGGMNGVFMDLDPDVLVGMTYLFSVVETGAMSTGTIQGFIGATIDAIVDSGGDKYISITIQPEYLDNNFKGTAVGAGSMLTTIESQLTASSFSLVR